jgi:branched-chain amino acid transport system substrate-binding protein
VSWPRPARGRRAAGIALALVGAALLLSGCVGSVSRGRHRFSTGRLVVYTSLPLIGPTRAVGEAVLDGERMALGAIHARIGRFAIALRWRDDATRASRGWDPGQTNANATLAAKDTRTIGYVGDMNSGASAVSLPILNRAHIPQISPLSTAVGLTRGGPEASPGEPAKYYPAITRTFARVVPNDTVQSAVQVALQRLAGCDRVFVLYDDDFDGRDAADSFQAAAKQAGLNVVGFDQFDSTAHDYRSLGAKLAKIGPDCVLISALVQDHAALVTDAVARALPTAALFVTSVAALPAFVDPRLGGIAERYDPRLTITAPTLARSDYPPAGRRVFTRFQRRYGPGAADGIWGYEAMSLMLAAIRRASDDGRRELTRRAVLHALFATRGRRGALGTYSIEPSGDTTLRRFGVYGVRAGRLYFMTAMRG